MDGVARTVHEFMKDRRAAAPDKGVLCYHDAKYDVEQWELKQVLLLRDIFFIQHKL